MINIIYPSYKKDYILYSNIEVANIICGTTIKNNLNYSYHTSTDQKEWEEIKKNRENILQELKFFRIITLKQIHSNLIHEVNLSNMRNYFNNPLIEGDGIITKLKGITIGVLTADCIPIYYTDSNGSFVGIAHVGWRGIKQKLHLKMLIEINRLYNIPFSKIVICFGPHIRVCCYQVNLDVISELNTKYYEKKNNSYYLNMEEIIYNDIVSLNKDIKNIYSYPVCTYCSKSPEFYSYRKGEMKLRNLNFIGIKEN